MSQFVESKNQERLWKASNKIPQFSALFYSHKHSLFKTSIQQVYDTIQTENISLDELQKYNRSVLLNLVTHLRNKQYNDQSSHIQQSNEPFFVESKDELFQREFKEKQDVYDKMINKPGPPDSSEMFKEKDMDEGRIQNMDELIAEYEKQRKQDITEVMPPPPVISDKSTSGNLSENEIQKNTYNEISISNDFSKTPSSPKLQYFLEIDKKIDLFLKKIEYIEKRLTELESSKGVTISKNSDV